MRGFKQKPISRLSVNGNAHDSSTECSGCSGGAVRTAGQEDSSIDSSASILAATSDTSNNNFQHIANANTSTIANADSTGMGGVDSGQSTKSAGLNLTKDTYATKSPVGFMITEALNRKLSHENSVDGMVGHAGVAVEELAGAVHGQSLDSIYANGMVDEQGTSSNSIVRLSRAVGVMPMPGIKPTALNTIIDAMGKVREVDFVMINQQAIDPNDDKPVQDSSLVVVSELPEQDGETVGEVTTPEAMANRELTQQVAAIESVSVVIRYRTVGKK